MFAPNMKSTDARVLEAIEVRDVTLRDHLAKVGEWAKSRGGNGGLLTRYESGALHIVGIVADSPPSGDWRELDSLVIKDGYAPRLNSRASREMDAMTYTPPSVPGVPASTVVTNRRGRPYVVSPLVVARDGVAFMHIDTGDGHIDARLRAKIPAADGTWVECSESERVAAFEREPVSA